MSTATRQSRTGHAACFTVAERILGPSGPVMTMQGACPLAIACAGVTGARLRSWVALSVTVAALVFGCLTYPVFVAAMTANSQPWPFGWLLPTGAPLCVSRLRERPGLCPCSRRCPEASVWRVGVLCFGGVTRCLGARLPAAPTSYSALALFRERRAFTHSRHPLDGPSRPNPWRLPPFEIAIASLCRLQTYREDDALFLASDFERVSAALRILYDQDAPSGETSGAPLAVATSYSPLTVTKIMRLGAGCGSSPPQSGSAPTQNVEPSGARKGAVCNGSAGGVANPGKFNTKILNVWRTALVSEQPCIMRFHRSPFRYEQELVCHNPLFV